MSRKPEVLFLVAFVIGAFASSAGANDCFKFVGAFDTPGETRGVAVSGSYAYLADGGL
jgi:hypothetical protein